MDNFKDTIPAQSDINSDFILRAFENGKIDVHDVMNLAIGIRALQQKKSQKFFDMLEATTKEKYD